MCFLHVMHRLIYTVETKEEDQRVKAGKSTSYMSVYKMLKFKMKVSYQRWLFNLSKGQLLHNAIYKTIVQRQRMA